MFTYYKYQHRTASGQGHVVNEHEYLSFDRRINSVLVLIAEVALRSFRCLGLNRYQCTICGVSGSYAKKVHMVTHYKYQHGTASGQVKCPNCRKVVKNERTLQYDHINKGYCKGLK